MSRTRGPLRFEALERRELLTGETVVGDARFVLYDDGVASTLDASFSRSVATVDALGDPVAVDARRFGEELHYSPALDWTDTGIELPGAGLQRVLGMGWDHDGVTPLMVFHDAAGAKLMFYRGYDFTVVNTVVMPGGDLLGNAVAGEQFKPNAAIVHHGLIVIAAERWVDDGGVNEPVGVDFLYTQDYGASFTRIPNTDGGFGVPILEEARGIPRLARWSFQNPFPAGGLDDSTSVWFPWADYLSKAGGPKGGQIGLFRADRPDNQSLWTVGPNRLVFSQWIEEDTGGLHAHTSAVTTGGLISHWGDVAYRSHSLFHRFDLNSYETAPVDTVFALGGYSSTPAAEQGAPQPVGAAPSPVPGGHLAGGDETPDHILSFGPMDDLDDSLTVASPIYRPERSLFGGIHQGAAVLHLQWMQGVGYVAGASVDRYVYFSPDGITWTEIRLPTPNANGVAWLYGDRLLSTQDGKIWTAAPPTIETVEPLTVSPGGANLVDPLFEQRGALAPGVAARRVVYQSGAWRYEDTQVALDVQAPPPAFGADAPVFEVTSDGLSDEIGSWWAQPAGPTSDPTQPHLADYRIANLATQELIVGASIGVVSESGGGSEFDSVRRFTVNDNTAWVAGGGYAQLTGAVTGRVAISLELNAPSPDSRFLIAFPYVGESLAPTYGLGGQAVGPDEVETVDVGPLGDAWSVGIVARQPSNARQTGNSVTPLASLVGPTGDAVVWSLEYVNTYTLLTVDVFDDGAPITRRFYFGAYLRGDWFESAVSTSSAGAQITMYTSGGRTLSWDVPGFSGLDLDTFQWAGPDGDVMVGVDPVLLFVDDEAWSEADHAEWLASSLTEKATFRAKPAPGDYNFDGVVNAADYTVWRDALPTPVPGQPGDANADGLVNGSDRAVWQAQYGASAVGLDGDFNGDGVVNALDYTVWRDAASPSVPSGSGADGDGSGFIGLSDGLVWSQAYGASYPSFEELAQSPAQPSSTSGVSAGAAAALPAALQAPSPEIAPSGSVLSDRPIDEPRRMWFDLLSEDVAPQNDATTEIDAPLAVSRGDDPSRGDSTALDEAFVTFARRWRPAVRESVGRFAR